APASSIAAGSVQPWRALSGCQSRGSRRCRCRSREAASSAAAPERAAGAPRGAEGAVVGEHVEAVAGALEGAAWFVSTIGAMAGVGAQQRRAIGWRHGARDREELI